MRYFLQQKIFVVSITLMSMVLFFVGLSYETQALKEFLRLYYPSVQVEAMMGGFFWLAALICFVWGCHARKRVRKMKEELKNMRPSLGATLLSLLPLIRQMRHMGVWPQLARFAKGWPLLLILLPLMFVLRWLSRSSSDESENAES